jgi:hypothetical protein
MIEIKDLLVKFSNLLIKEEVKKVAVAEVLSEIIRVKIKTEDIRIKNNIIYLNIKPIYKNEILLKQEQILLKLKEVLGKKTPTALR